MRYTKIFIVRWADCDANGHMRNTAYSEYAIDTRMSWLADQGWPFSRFEEIGIGPVLLREEIDYVRELRLGDSVEVDLTGLGLSSDGARWKLAHEFWRPGGKTAARIVLSGAWMGMESRRLVVPPDGLTEAMRKVPQGPTWEELAPLKPRE
jgi:acyl-CoA thioester hydrolase